MMDCHGLRPFHEPVVIANVVRQSMAPKYMDRHGLRPRDDDAGSRSVCGSDPELEARNDGPPAGQVLTR